MPRPLLLAHRGANRAAFENTVPAFDRALVDGCDGFEFDVRCTVEGRLLLCHDPAFRHQRVEACSFDDLCHAGRQRGIALACVEEVLVRYGRTAYLDIEMKVTGGEAALVKALAACPPQRGFVVSSFVREVIGTLAQIDASLPLGLVCRRAFQLQAWEALPITHLIPHRSLVDEKLVAAAHAAGKQVIVWTVNRAPEMHRLAALGVDGIISDETELVRRTLGQAGFL